MIIKCFGSESTGNCYILSDGTNDIMVEAGISLPSVKKQYDKYVSELEGVFVTHRHGDHSDAIKRLLKASCNVFANKDTIEHLKLKGRRIETIQAGEIYCTPNWKVYIFNVFHDVPAVGFLIYSKKLNERLLFINDTVDCNHIFNKLDYVMIECNYDKEIIDYNVLNENLRPAAARRIKKSHFELHNVIDYLKSCDLKQTKQIVLMHLSNGNSNAEDFKQRVQEATGVPTVVAQKGMVLEWL